MKINQLKVLSVAACCVVISLWTEIQGAELGESQNNQIGSAGARSYLLNEPRAYYIEKSNLINCEFTWNNEHNIPDRWVLSDHSNESRPGGIRLKEFPLTIERKSIGEVEIKGAYNNFYCIVPELQGFVGEVFLLSADIKSPVPGARISYGCGWDVEKKYIQSKHHTGGGDWENLRVQFIVNWNVTTAVGQRLYLCVVGGETNNPQHVFGIKNVKLWQLKTE